MRGNAKTWRGKYTDDDLDQVAGKYDVLACLLHDKYGYTRQNADEEIDKRMAENESRLKK